MSTINEPTMALNRVKTLARRMSWTDREVVSVTWLTSPRSIRSATSDAESPVKSSAASVCAIVIGSTIGTFDEVDPSRSPV